jgi:hypothetical protein
LGEQKIAMATPQVAPLPICRVISLGTIKVFADFVRKVWRFKIVFRRLNLPNPGKVPIGPTAVIEDNISFTRLA